MVDVHRRLPVWKGWRQGRVGYSNGLILRLGWDNLSVNPHVAVVPLPARVPAPRDFVSFNMFLWLQPAFWRFNVCQFVFSYFIKFRTVQFERFHLQHVQMVNKTSSFKAKSIANKAEVSGVNCNSHILGIRLPITN